VQGAAAARQASAAESGSLPPLVGSEPNPANSAIAQDPAAIESSVRQINDYVQTLNRDIEFSVDKEHNRTIIKVIDSDTGEVIRQLPPEDVLQLAKRLEQMDGLLVREKA
jgi:flagellar protein FlaG